MPNYLFLFTLGPVQGFIAQARKTRDLAAGSQILSELAKAGIKAADTHGCKSIFPHYTDANKIDGSIPNRFLVRFENPAKPLKDIGEAVEKAVRDTWTIMASDALNGLKPTLPSKLFKDKWEDQIANQWQIFWAFQEISGDYGKAHDETEKLVGSIKNTRIFNQIPEVSSDVSAPSLASAMRWCFLRGKNTTTIKTQ